jgi:lipopolysaccharide biosynthesis glycosyltransferase
MNSQYDETPVFVTAADAGYLPYLACFLASLGDHPPGGTPCLTVVIHRGIAVEDRIKLGRLTGGEVMWVEPDSTSLRSIGAPPSLAESTPHYYRLLAPYCLPERSRAIYMDADTMLCGDPLALWNSDLKGHLLAATRDYLPCVKDAITNWEQLGLTPDARYFNSGVMVIDLERWRKEDLPRRVLETCQTNQRYLRAQGRWPQYDQYGLNCVAHLDWQQIDPSWNYGTDLPLSESRVIHFVGNGKVGLPTCQSQHTNRFFTTLSRTPYAGYRINASIDYS